MPARRLLMRKIREVLRRWRPGCSPAPHRCTSGFDPSARTSTVS